MSVEALTDKAMGLHIAAMPLGSHRLSHRPGLCVGFVEKGGVLPL